MKMTTILQKLTSPYRTHSAMPALSRVAVCFLIAAYGLLLSCNRYDLELYHDGTADVLLTYDWMTDFKKRPDGMTVMLARNGDSIGLYNSSNDIDRLSLDLHGGDYYVTTINGTFGEFSTMRFFRRNSHNDIYAVANTYNITGENDWDNGRQYMVEPEKIGVAIDTFHVSETTDELTFYKYDKKYVADTLHLVRPQTVMPMTTTLDITVKVRGISYMRSLDGYITGMADGFYLNQLWRRKESGALKLNRWSRDWNHASGARKLTDEAETNVGWMKTSVETFGLPHGRELLQWRTPGSNYIVLHFTLIDGRVVEYAYNVGLDIRYKGDDGTLDYFAPGDVALELDLEIDTPNYKEEEVPNLPYAQPSGTGAFDAEVADWGDEQNVDVPM